MIKHIEHIGIAVENIEEALKTYENLLGVSCYKTEIVESELVRTAFLKIGDSKIELLEAMDPISPIGKFLAKKGEGFHHIAFEVDDIHAEIKRLRSLGFEMIHETPKPGADNKLIAFLHPKSTQKLLVEICQEIL
jgi:methylmalonyl-CoA/ethylmalonyl-CoA epimerase